jgi:hypothetical protein
MEPTSFRSVSARTTNSSSDSTSISSKESNDRSIGTYMRMTRNALQAGWLKEAEDYFKTAQKKVQNGIEDLELIPDLQILETDIRLRKLILKSAINCKIDDN